MRIVSRVVMDSLSPLRVPTLRIYLSAQAVSQVGTWVQATAQSWVAWQLVHSAAVLGTISVLGSLPTLVLGPWVGLWADRLQRRWLLVVTQSTAMMLAFVLALLVQTGRIELWHILVLSTLLGCVSALDQPTHQAFLGDLAGPAEVRKAVVINAMIVQTSRMVGPALAGWLIGILGMASAFWLNGVSFLSVIVSLLRVRVDVAKPPMYEHSLREVWKGLQYVANQPRVADLFAITVLTTFCGIPVVQFLPPLVTDVLRRDAVTLGLLTSASGAGSVVGALFAAPIAQQFRRTGLVLSLAVGWSGVWFATLAVSRWVSLSASSLFLAGLAVPVVMTGANGLLQTLAPQRLRTKLIALWITVGTGTHLLGSMALGFMSHLVGVVQAIFWQASLMAVGAAALLLLRTGLSAWEANRSNPSNGTV